MKTLGWRMGWVAVAALPIAFLTIFFLWPTSALVTRGFHDGGWTFDPLIKVFSSARTWRAIGFALSSAAIATVSCLLLGLPGAYLLFRCQFPGRGLLRAIVTMPFVLPTVVVGVAFGAMLRPDGVLGWANLSGTPVAIIAAMVFFNYSVVVRTVGALWARLDPRLTQAAATLGVSPASALWRVTLPALSPAIASATTVVFLFSVSAYGIVMTLGQSRYATLETEIWFRTTQLLDLPGAAALSIAQLVIVTLVLGCSNFTQQRMTRALKLQPDTAAEHRLSLRRDGFALVITGAVVICLIGLPLAHLVWRSLHRNQQFSTINYTQLASQGGLGVSVWSALQTSLITATAATAIALTLGVLVSLVVSRRPRHPAARQGLALLESVFLLPLGVSAVTVGFGYLITLNKPPFDLRSSLILIPLAQAVVALPLVVRTILPVLRAIDPRQLQAAQLLGSGAFAVLWRIELPQVLRALGLAAGFAFAVSLGEFGATSFLARPDNPTLPVLIFRLFSRPGADNYGLALAASVVLAVLAALAMALAERLRPREVATWV